MSRQIKRTGTWFLIALTLLTGCQPIQPFYLNDDGDLSHYLDVATDIEHTEVYYETLEEVSMARAPLTVANPQFDSIWELSLEEAVQTALSNSKVIRTFGQVQQFGQIVASAPNRLTAAPDAATSVYDPALTETDPQRGGGIEQALSNFDAQFNSSATWNATDRPQNFTAVFTPVLVEDQVTINNEITKRSATGTQWFFRNVSIYDDSNQTIRALPSDWFTALEAEIRHPLLRGRGTQVNRVPVVLARIRTDISLAEFEDSVQNLVSEVERAYWELYFFYRNLNAAMAGRDSALATWKKINALLEVGQRGGTADQEAQTREQYYLFVNQVQNALNDLYKSETRLRYLMGLAPTDGRLIRPADEPVTARLDFDWNSILSEALQRSVNIRRQKWKIKQREMEMIAVRNTLLPQLDVVALYRWLGMGDQYLSTNRRGLDFPAVGSFAWDELFGGNYQESQLGFQLNIPIGFREELANVRKAQLELARETALLEEMELEVSHRLTDAIQELASQYAAVVANYNRWVAAEQRVESLQAIYEVGKVTLDLLLDAQRFRADAETQYYQALVEYNTAVMVVHLRKGSILEYDGVLLAEGPWPGKAYNDAEQVAHQRDASYFWKYGYNRPDVISHGPFAQHSGASQPPIGGLSMQPTPANPTTLGVPSSTEVLPAPLSNPAEISPLPQPPLQSAPQSVPQPAGPVDSQPNPASVNEANARPLIPMSINAPSKKTLAGVAATTTKTEPSVRLTSAQVTVSDSGTGAGSRPTDVTASTPVGTGAKTLQKISVKNSKMKQLGGK
ncbi:MAG: TolC family protein [Pirellulaceae bacterium]|nr:TolC family protein [Planctomycetales bacterium]